MADLKSELLFDIRLAIGEIQAIGDTPRGTRIVAVSIPSSRVERYGSDVVSSPRDGAAIDERRSVQTAGRNALTLIRDQNLTVVLTVLKAGAVLQEHHAPAPVTLLPLFGNLILLALTRARELSHPFSQARALNIATWVHQYRREVQQTREQVEELLVIARAQDFAQWVTLGTIMSGWVLAMQGREEGVAQISQGLNANRNLSIELAHSYLFSLLTEAYAQMGQREEGLRVLAEALTLVEKNDERFYEAELHRLKGELLKPRHNYLYTSAEIN